MTINVPFVKTHMPRIDASKITLDEPRWNSVGSLLDDAEAFVAPARLQGLSSDAIDSIWRSLWPGHDVPGPLREFLLRAGQEAPFFNRDFENSYRPEYYAGNCAFAGDFLGAFSSGGETTILHRSSDDGAESSPIVVIACNVGRGDYYCMDALDDTSTVVRLHAEYGDLSEEPMTMIDFLGLELINYASRNAPRKE